jgi:hypothetical protein
LNFLLEIVLNIAEQLLIGHYAIINQSYLKIQTINFMLSELSFPAIGLFDLTKHLILSRLGCVGKDVDVNEEGR